MKRDMDVIRALLLWVESDQKAELDPQRLLGLPEEVIGYHLQLMIDQGLLEGKVMEVPSPGRLLPTKWLIRRLTWEGHDFLDAARDDRLWRKAIETIASKGGSMTFDILQSLLSALIRSGLGIP